MTIFSSWVFAWAAAIGTGVPDSIPIPTVISDQVPYHLDSPSRTIILEDKDLVEISGLSPSGEPGILCAISDEKGEVLFLDANQNGEIVRRIKFRDKGDFEGVEKVGNRLFALRSNGEIFEMAIKKKKKRAKPKVYATPLTKDDDVEGLGYDSLRQALLVACKGNPKKASVRLIFSFDLKTKQLSEKPVFTIDPMVVNDCVDCNEEDKNHFFSPSGIAVHPLTGDVYVISTALKRLVVLDYATGNIKYASRVFKKMLPQPEGIAFDSEGNLFLSSEGKKGDAKLLRFDYVKP